MHDGKIKMLIEKNITVPAGGTYEALDILECGALEFALVDSTSDALELLIQLDDQPSPDNFVAIAELSRLGLEERISYHPYVTKFVTAPANEFIAVQSNDFPEPYRERIRFALRNPTSADITVRRIELRRVVFNGGR